MLVPLLELARFLRRQRRGESWAEMRPLTEDSDMEEGELPTLEETSKVKKGTWHSDRRYEEFFWDLNRVLDKIIQRTGIFAPRRA